MAKLVQFTVPGAYNTVWVNPLTVVLVTNDEKGEVFLAFSPHPKEEERCYVVGELQNVLLLLNEGLSD